MPITEKKRKYLKEYRQKNKGHIKKVSRKRYVKNKDIIKETVKEWNRKYGYASDKIPHRRKLANIRRATRHKYPLEGEKCIFCGNDAEVRHHNTEPIELDKFWFMCERCHLIIHNCIPFGEDTTLLEAKRK